MAEHLSQGQADEFAVGSLDPDLERSIRLHIADCADCRRAVEEANRVAALLALSAPLHPAPERLKARVVTRAGIRRPLWARVLSVGQAAAGIAAVFVAIAAFTGMVSMRSQVADLRQQNGELSTKIQDVASQEIEIFGLSKRLTESERKAAEIEVTNAKAGELLAAMLNPASETAQVVNLAGAGSSVGGLVWDPGQDRLWVHAQKLPKLADNQTYQIWVESGGKYLYLGPLVPNDNGTATFDRYLPEGIARYGSVIVSIETAGGSGDRKGTGVFYVANLPRP